VIYELLTPDLNRKIEFLWVEYTAGSVAHPEPMSHPGEENAVCLEGSVIVTVEGQEFILQRGRQHLLRQRPAPPSRKPPKRAGNPRLGNHTTCILILQELKRANVGVAATRRLGSTRGSAAEAIMAVDRARGPAAA
jgi:hypothetical protein